MKALILAGGKGTRLRPLTVYTPKPIVPFLNKPFLLYQIEILRRAEILDITLSLNYQPHKIEQILGDGSDYGVNLQFITEPLPMGTGGAFKYACDSIRETTVVLNGDILTDADVSDIIKFHRKQQAEITIALASVENPTGYGLVETDETGKVLLFREKPKPEDIARLETKNINAGIYVLEPGILDVIPKGVNTSFEYNIFPDLLSRQKSFYAYILDGCYWRDIGTPQSYLDAHHDFFEGKIKRLEIEYTANNSDIAHTAIVDKSSIVGEDCIIKPNARIINSVIGAGVHIEEKALIENSVIWSHARISSAAHIENAVIGRSCYIGRNVSIGGAVLGDKTSLTDYTQI
jgi:NDP-sugar pyrophosphorylase family protein